MHVENDERKRLYGDSYVQMVYLNLILLFWLYLINHPLRPFPEKLKIFSISLHILILWFLKEGYFPCEIVIFLKT